MNSREKSRDCWIKECLYQAELSVCESPENRTSEFHGAIGADSRVVALLEEIVLASEQNGFHSFLQPYCRIPVHIFAALGVGWHYCERSFPSNAAVLLVTQDDSAWDLLNRIHVCGKPIRSFYPIARVKRSLAFAGNFASEKLYHYPRVVIINELTDEVIQAAGRLGISVRTILFDGCSARAPNPFIATPSLGKSRTSLSIIHLSPVRQQRESIYPEPAPLKRGAHSVIRNNGIPILVFPSIRLNEIQVNQIRGNLPDIWNIMKDVRGQDRIKKDIVRHISSLQQTLAALPVPSAVYNTIWHIPSNVIPHPITGRLSAIRALLRSLYEHGDPDSNRIAEALTLLNDGAKNITSSNPKTVALLSEIGRLSDINQPTVVTFNKTMASALKQYLLQQEIPADVRYWKERSFNWSPAEVPVIITCPPPHYEEWKMAIPLSPHLSFVLWPLEIRILLARMKKAGFKTEGHGAEKLMNFVKSTGDNELDDYVREEQVGHPSYLIETMLESQPVELFPYSPQNEDKISDGLARVIPINLYPKAVLWARPSSIVVIAKRNGASKVKCAKLERGDYVVIPESGTESEPFEALVQAAEKRNEDKVLSSRLWRTALLEFMDKNKLEVEELHRILIKHGLNVTELTVRNWILKEITIGPQDDEAVRIIGETTGDTRCLDENSEIRDAIRCIRGLHQNQGRILSKLKEACATGLGDEDRQVLEKTFGITVGDLYDSLSWYRVESVCSLQNVPSYLAGTVSQGESA